MNNTKISNNEILFSRKGELVRITPCGDNAIRFQAFPSLRVDYENYTLMPQSVPCEITDDEHFVTMTVGTLMLKMYHDGKVFFYNNGNQIIEEQPELTFHSKIRDHKCIGNDLWKSRVTFMPNDDEMFFGMGHSFDNQFNLKGSTVDIINTNAKCTIPFYYSSLGYGFLWNVPSTGLAEFGNNRTRFTSDACKFIDYVVIGGNAKQASKILADITGHAPLMPYWATGFWQSRLRYENQDELLKVSRRYKDEGIPLSVIIIDYFHWTEQGDYKFDPKCWYDVQAMTNELHDMGTKLYVSVWPTVNGGSENYSHMIDNNLLMRTTRGSERVFDFYGWNAEIDVTNPETRKFVFSRIKENYLDNGVDGLWYDEAEPEIHPEHFDNLVMYKGRGDAVGLLYPYYYAKMAYDGLKSMGRDDIVTLTRCAYTGAQKFGALVWSGDNESSFESLACQVNACINMSLCGIPWWNTDIGGFYGGDITSDYFKELIVRWFQFGVFSPVMRLHGSRNRHYEPEHVIKEPTGDPNELWSFGEENFEILKDLVFLRERLRPYIKKCFDTSSELGYPVVRPMFFEYPDDDECYKLNEQYLFGEDIIFAPIVNQGQSIKSFYVPDGEWILVKDKKVYSKGYYDTTVSLTDMVVLVKKGSDVLNAFE